MKGERNACEQCMEVSSYCMLLQNVWQRLLMSLTVCSSYLYCRAELPDGTGAGRQQNTWVGGIQHLSSQCGQDNVWWCLLHKFNKHIFEFMWMLMYLLNLFGIHRWGHATQECGTMKHCTDALGASDPSNACLITNALVKCRIGLVKCGHTKACIPAFFVVRVRVLCDSLPMHL